MITSHFDIPGATCRTYRLRPFGDLQYGSKGFDRGLWDRFVEEVKADKDGMTIGLGDYTDLFRPSLRGRIDGSFVGDEDSKDNFNSLHRKHMEKVAEMLAPVIKAGIGCLGLVDGHHYVYYQDTQMTSTQYLCMVLKDMTSRVVPYLGEMTAFVVVRFMWGRYRIGHGQASMPLVIHVQHGEGAANFSSTDLIKLERKTAPSFQADLFLRGHSTKLYAAGHDVLYPAPKSSNVLHKSILLVNTGGFMRGYDSGGRASYVEKKMLPPARLGWATVNIELTKNKFTERTFLLTATI